MNLWDIPNAKFHDTLLELTAGSKEGGAELRQKLGEPCPDGGASLGSISSYYVSRYGFSPECKIVPFTGARISSRSTAVFPCSTCTFANSSDARAER